MKDWDLSVPCVLPRVISGRGWRNNTLPVKLPKPNIRLVPLGEVNGRWTGWRRSDYFYPEMIPDPDYSESDEEEEEEESTSEDEEESTEYNEDAERSRRSNEDDEDAEEEDENKEDAKKRKAPLGRAPLASPESLSDDQPNKRDEKVQKTKSETAPRLKKSQSKDEDLIKPKKPSNPLLESSERKNLYKELKFKQKHGTSIKNQKSELQRALEKYSESRVKRELAASRRTSLENILEQQALKLELQERDGRADHPAWIDRLQRQHVPRLTDPKTDEFFRVHARVVSHLLDESSSAPTESDS